MPIYANGSGRSGVASYEVGKGFIRVYFSKGGSYTYTNDSVGADAVSEMISLANAGQGLNGFINTSVKEDYDDAHDYE